MIADQNNTQQEQLKNFLLKNSAILGFDVQKLISIEQIINIIADHIELNMEFCKIIFPDQNVYIVSTLSISQVLRKFFSSDFSKDVFGSYEIKSPSGYNLQIFISKANLDVKAIADDYAWQQQKFKIMVLSIFEGSTTPIAVKDIITTLESLLNDNQSLKISLKNILLKLIAKNANLEEKVCLMPGDIVRYLRKIDCLEQVGTDYKNLFFRLNATTPILYYYPTYTSVDTHNPYAASTQNQEDLYKQIKPSL